MEAPVIIASDINFETRYFAGAGFTFNGGDDFSAEFTDTDGKREKVLL